MENLELAVSARTINENFHRWDGSDVRFASSALRSGTAENGDRNDSTAIRSRAELGTTVTARNFFADSLNNWATHGDGFGSHATLTAFGAFSFNDDLLFHILSDLLLNETLTFTTLVRESLLFATIVAILELDVLAAKAKGATAARRKDECSDQRGDGECEMFHGVGSMVIGSDEGMQTNYDGRKKEPVSTSPPHSFIPYFMWGGKILFPWEKGRRARGLARTILPLLSISEKKPSTDHSPLQPVGISEIS